VGSILSENKKSYEVLARKYRPGRLSELVGQEMLVQTLTNAIKDERIPHAFMMTGIRGVGKTSTARIIARSLVCTGSDGRGNKPTTDPCGVCDNCRAIAESRHVDVIEIDAASHTGVDEIREIIENVRYLPVSARYKIYIIDEVHMLSKSAFNALLKTLEEPPSHAKFILATTEVRKIPVTILSRCMRFDLPRIDAQLLADHLSVIAEKEGAKIEKEALMLISYYAEGSARDALSLLDQAIGNRKDEIIKVSGIRQMLGIADRESIFSLFEFMVAGEAAKAVGKLRSMYKSGASPLAILQDLLELSHFLTQIKIMPDMVESSHISEGDRKRGDDLSQKLSLPFLARIWQMLVKGVEETKTVQNQMMAAEMILVRISYSSDLPTPGDLIKEIEKKKDSMESVSVKGNIKEEATTALFTEKKKKLNNPHNFDEMVKMFDEMKEHFISTMLHDVSLINFDARTCRVEFCPSRATPNDLAGKVGNLLSEWTGNRWVVAISNNNGEKPLRQKMEEELENRKNKALENENVARLLETFPGAVIEKIEPVFEEEQVEKTQSNKLISGEAK